MQPLRAGLTRAGLTLWEGADRPSASGEVGVATQVFSEAELERLRGFPELDRDELIRFFTVTPSDEVFVRSHRGSANHLGVAVQLCALPWLLCPTT